MRCPICDQKAPNCDCTATERAHHGLLEDAIYEIDLLRAEIARLREERRWIPVGERLPDLDVEVLVWQQGYTAIGWREHRPWYTVPKTIWTLGDDLDKGYPPEKITHWMPLPAPPSEGEVE